MKNTSKSEKVLESVGEMTDQDAQDLARIREAFKDTPGILSVQVGECWHYIGADVSNCPG